MQFFLATLHLYQDIWRIGGDRAKVTLLTIIMIVSLFVYVSPFYFDTLVAPKLKEQPLNLIRLVLILS